MHAPLNESISVIAVFDADKKLAMPKKMKWHGREYLFTKLAYHHKVAVGRTLMHIFHLTDGTLDFRLRLNTVELSWHLEEVYDPTG